MSSTGPFLYPSVTSLPTHKVEPSSEGLGQAKKNKPGEFDQVFDQVVKNAGNPSLDLNQMREPLKFSAHAMQRLSQRNIKLEPKLMNKVVDAVNKAGTKGLRDTLVLTPDAALIVNIKNRTVVTAMDRDSLNGNVFTNIDGAVIV